MIILHNCDELLDFMLSNYDSLYQGCVEFEGDIIEYNCMIPSTQVQLILSPKYTRTAFFVGRTIGDKFVLSIAKDLAFIDELPSVVLSKYVKAEIIATIRDEW